MSSIFRTKIRKMIVVTKLLFTYNHNDPEKQIIQELCRFSRRSRGRPGISGVYVFVSM